MLTSLSQFQAQGCDTPILYLAFDGAANANATAFAIRGLGLTLSIAI